MTRLTSGVLPRALPWLHTAFPPNSIGMIITPVGPVKRAAHLGGVTSSWERPSIGTRRCSSPWTGRRRTSRARGLRTPSAALDRRSDARAPWAAAGHRPPVLGDRGRHRGRPTHVRPRRDHDDPRGGRRGTAPARLRLRIRLCLTVLGASVCYPHTWMRPDRREAAVLLRPESCAGGRSDEDSPVRKRTLPVVESARRPKPGLPLGTNAGT